MKLIAVSGMLDSGKTTLIRELIVRLSARGKRCGVIVNEDGIAQYDEVFVRSHDLRVEPLRGG